MTFFRNFVVVTGSIALAYVMFKLLKSNSNKSSDKNSDKDTPELSCGDKTEKIASSQSLPQKRKLESNKGTMKLFKPKPNFFIAFQVKNAEIHKKVKSVQQQLIKKTPMLYSAIINVSTLHVTLAVTHLGKEIDIKSVKDKLDEWAEKNVKSYFQDPCIVTFNGVKTFGNAVAYVDIEKDDNYKKISELSSSINNFLSTAGYYIDSRSFTPHLTFLKLSKDFKLVKSKAKFREDFQSLKEIKAHFGTQHITHLQLLSMDEPKDEFGYYKCYHEIKVSDVSSDMKEDDHSECCEPIPKPKITKES